MRVIDGAGLVTGERQAGLLARLQGGEGEMRSREHGAAQKVLIAALQRVLDNRFTLFYNLLLEGLEVPIPAVIVGPPAIWVVNVNAAKGIYRVTEEGWEELHERTQRFRPARPNLVVRTRLFAEAVRTYLQARLERSFPVEGVLFFSNPGVHVELIRPAVRIVLVDAMERFIIGVAQGFPRYDVDQVRQVVDALGGGRLEGGEPQPPTEVQDAFSFLETPEAAPPPPAAKVILDRSESGLVKKIPLSSRQWFLLAVFAVVDIVLLVVFAVLLLVYY